ncbi:MAG: adenylate/guanylate cyclase domain-containing protein [Sedimentitalea sp.]
MTRARIASGLVLFIYAFFHFLNIGFGLISPDLMERAQDWRLVITRTLLGEILLYGALIIHAGLAFFNLAARRSLRMPLHEAVQIVFGLTIPIFLIVHIVFTRVAHEQFAVNDDMAYLIGLIFGSASGWQQNLLLLLVWLHGCMGMHMWLRSQRWWRQSIPWLIGLAVLVPAFAMAGFLTEGRRLAMVLQDPDQRTDFFALVNWPDGDAFASLIQLTDQFEMGFWALLAVTLLIYLIRKLQIRRSSVRIRYVDGPLVTSPKGMTLLEISRSNGIPHTSLCGGRGRCSTCRVMIEEGGENLPPPSPSEAAVLAAVNAPPGSRLACQLRPTDAATVYRMFQQDGKRSRAHASQGQERRMAILFLDIRGFTARTTGQLPYDVVFMLNRFFDAIVPAITQAGGTVDKYLGDGLLAIFETADEISSARAALSAVADLGVRLEQFNVTLTKEGAPAVRIGIGLHLGDLVLGEIGAAGDAPRTIIGEAVNAASRLESQTKDLGVELLVSEAVLEAAGQSAKSLPLATLNLRGVAEPVKALPVAVARNLPDLLPPATAPDNTG